MPRRVPVILDLDARGYITSAVKATEATKAMDAQMGALDREVDKVDRDMAELAVTTEAAKRQVDDLGDKSRGTAADLSLLDARIKATKVSVRELGLEFARTGDKAAGTELGRERSLLYRLEKLRKELSDLEQQASGGGSAAGGGFATSFAGAVSGMPVKGPLIGALIGAAVLAAPTIGAILGGAVAGAAGTGAMAIGILSAVKDPRVQSAAKSFGDSISTMFFAGGEPFVQPILDGLDILERGFADLDLGDALAKAAPTVTVIAQGLADAAKNFMPGFNKFLDRIGPLADTAASGLADMGSALGEFIDDVSASKGTVEGLQTLFTLVNGTIRGLGNTLSWLGDRFHEWNVAQAKVFGDLEDVFGALGLDDLSRLASTLNDSFERMTGTGSDVHKTISRLNKDGLDPFAGYLHHAWSEMEQLRGETEATRQGLLGYWDTLRGIADANIAWEQAIDDLTDSVKENGTSLDITTQKGRNNVQAVYAGLDAAKRQYEQGKITAQQYDEQIGRLVELGVKAGLSRKQLEDLAGTYRVTIIVDALVPAVKGALDVLSKAMKQIFGGGGGGGEYTGRGEYRASGGPLVPGVPYVFGEQGPEIGVFGQSGYMYSNAQSSALAQQWQGSSGGGRYVIENHITLIDPMTGTATRKTLITDASNRGVPQSTIAAAYP